MTAINKITTAFAKLSGAKPRIFQSPGRINVIGDHTDYNMGLVLPAAIDKYVTMALAPNDGKRIHINALDINEELTYELSNSSAESKEHWSNYFVGVSNILRARGLPITGFDCVFTSDIPIGAGLSSSAAICCCLAFALNKIFDGGLSREQLVNVAQRTEHEYIGLQCGIMDQTASLFGEKDHVLMIDCETKEVSYAPLSLGNYSFLICDSQVKHSLASSGYNDRKNECDQAVEVFNVTSLREISSYMLNQKRDLDPLIKKRVSFVIEENDRVIKTSQLIQKGELIKVGQLLYASHAGLSTMYEVSCEEMDFLVESTIDMPSVIGARMMGGGFGGCTINLLETSYINTFKENISFAYEDNYGIVLKFIDVNIADGTNEMIA